MSDVMMKALQLQVESLTRQVDQLGPEKLRNVHDDVAIAAIQGLCVGYWSNGGIDAADIVTTANQVADAFIAARALGVQS